MADPQRALVSAQEEFGRRLPPGWAIKSWRADVHRNHRLATYDQPYGPQETTLDVAMIHEPTRTEFTIRCTEAPDWEWLTAELRLAERTQSGVEVSVAHGRWWW